MPGSLPILTVPAQARRSSFSGILLAAFPDVVEPFELSIAVSFGR
jgi:hypothetical protein